MVGVSNSASANSVKDGLLWLRNALPVERTYKRCVVWLFLFLFKLKMSEFGSLELRYVVAAITTLVIC